ncbi:MAG TPA: hypothetical protein VMW52_03510 [Phycisphaerae bacterium]|nr:hypothetical protein [Phycisphaerae bacterium]
MMTPDTFDAGLAGLVLGFVFCLVLWVSAGRRKPRHERVREHLLALARGEASNLPEPDNRDVAEMMTDARLAANRHVPYALSVLALGRALLLARRQAAPPDSAPRSAPPTSRAETRADRLGPTG